MNRTPYDKRPDVIGLELPHAHMICIKTPCSSYVKNMERMMRNDGTIHASARPRKIRTTKSEAKLLHGICNNKIPPLCAEKSARISIYFR